MKVIMIITALMLPLLSIASTNQGDFFSDMQATGKYYVVVAVLLIILVGIFSYLIRLDMKLTKLEKSHKQED